MPWRLGAVYTDVNERYRWEVVLISGDRAVLQDQSSTWAKTNLLTYEEWNDRGQWLLAPTVNLQILYREDAPTLRIHATYSQRRRFIAMTDSDRRYYINGNTLILLDWRNAF